MIKKIFILVMILGLISCATTSGKRPVWVDSKPGNSDSTIYFTYGPSGSRQEAKEQVYKEISEYFGIKVSSFDKFVKVVDYSDGERSIDQTAQTNIDIESREKGLQSIEIRETWYDSKNDQWYIFVSLDSASEKKIREQVEIDIENERVQGILSQGEAYSIDSQEKLNRIKDLLLQLKRLNISMEQSLQKINGLTINSDIMNFSRGILTQSLKADALIKNIGTLENEIQIVNKKNEILLSKIDGHEVEQLQLELYIKESGDSVLNAYDIAAEVASIENDIQYIKDEADRAYIEAELEILGSEEDQKKRLEDLRVKIGDNYTLVKEYRDRTNLLRDQAEDNYRKLKQLLNSESRDYRALLKDMNSGIDAIKDGLLAGEDAVREVALLQTAITLDIEESLGSTFVTKDMEEEYGKILKGLSTPVTWVEANKDKLIIINGNAQEIVDKFRIRFLLDIEIERVLKELSSNETPLELTVGTFTIADTKIGAEFSNYLRDKITLTAANIDGITLIEYDEVKDALNSANISPDELIEDLKSKVDLVDNMIYGNYWEYNNEVEIKLNIKNLNENKIFYGNSIRIPKRSIPSEFDLKPKNLDKIIKTSSNLSGDFLKGFRIWPDKGTGTTYYDGEEMVMHLHSPVSGYVKIYHISADNELTLVFPNKFDVDNRVVAGGHYTIGDGSYPFKFKLGRPYGTESIKAVFSTEQFSDLNGIEYRDGFLYSGLRGIEIEDRRKNDFGDGKFVTTSYYTIVK